MIIILIIMKIDYHHHHCHHGSGRTTAAGRKQRSTTDCGSRATKSNKYDIFKIVMTSKVYYGEPLILFSKTWDFVPIRGGGGK